MEMKLLHSSALVTGWRMEMSFKEPFCPSVNILNVPFSHDFSIGGVL